MSNIFEKVVNNIVDKTHFNSLDIASELDLKHEQVVEVIKLIYKTGDYFMLNDKCQERWSLTDLGISLLKNRKQLKLNLIESNQVQNNECDKETYFNLNRIKNGDTLENEEKLDTYEFKKYIEKTMIKYLEGEMINKDALINIKLEFSVSEDMLQNDKWKTISLLPYNFNEMATKLQTGLKI
ncbi:hypothetical protein O3M35_008510 [Rhynocoris fuscipes]|uniref:Uncharacterized protein n=1 Tax=Rhynocoris fuscipes TaxID=488301 RepID=A0AAW1D777_9HEMI